MTVALLLIALLLVVAVGLVLRRRAAAVAPPEAPLTGLVPIPGEAPRGPPLPVVLVHGLFGFDCIGMLHYFRGIPRTTSRRSAVTRTRSACRAPPRCLSERPAWSR